MKTQDKSSFFNKTHLNEEAIALCVDALVLDKERTLPAIIRDHVEECQHCKKEIFTIYKIAKKNGNIMSMPEDRSSLAYSADSDKKTEKNTWNTILKIAALLVLITGISVLVYYLVMPTNNLYVSKDQSPDILIKSDRPNNKVTLNSDKKILESNKLAKKEASEKTSSENNILAENTKESELFENLINSHYRSDDIEIASPLQEQQFSANQTIIFKFNGDMSEPYLIKIYNNKEEKQFEKDNISTNSYTLETKLSSGLYYWKLERDDDLMYVGKFYVK